MATIHRGDVAGELDLDRPVPPPSRGHRFVVHGWWGVVWFALGAVVGAHRLADNSFLTHLATGRLILDHGAPHADPYSFTAAGRPWLVQSWLASVVYAGLERSAGLWAVRLLVGVATGAVVAGVWRLTRPAHGLVARTALTVASCGVGLSWWNERPQMFAFALLVGALLIVCERRPSWWLVPVFAAWVNLHGSFVLGVAAVVLVAFALGGVRRALLPGVAAALGSVVGAMLSPYGTELLTFPVRLLGRSESLSYIAEWKRPSLLALDVLLLLALGVVGARHVRRARAWSWVPLLVVFGGLAATSGRNIAVTALVVVPLAARGMPRLGVLPDHPPVTPGRAVAGGAAVLALLALVIPAMSPHLALDEYPVQAVEWMEDRGLAGRSDVRVVTHDFVGNYLEWRYGTSARVFVDDRAELYPAQVVRDYVWLLSDRGDWREILDRYDADVVLWKRDTPLARHLQRAAGWKVVYRDAGYLVAVRDGA